MTHATFSSKNRLGKQAKAALVNAIKQSSKEGGMLIQRECRKVTITCSVNDDVDQVNTDNRNLVTVSYSDAIDYSFIKGWLSAFNTLIIN